MSIFGSEIVILDEHGRIVPAALSEQGAGRPDWFEGRSFSQMVRSTQPVYSDVIFADREERRAVAVFVPITGSEGEPKGGIAGLVHLRPTTSGVFQESIANLHLGESARIFLVDGNGRVIHHSKPEHIGEDFSSLPEVRRALAGEAGSFRTRDADGRDIVASFAPVPGTSWGVVTEESWASLTRSSRRYGRFSLVLLALGLGVPMVIVGIGVRRIMGPVKELIGAAHEVAAGDFDQLITVATGDELEVLAEQFNVMATRLQESYEHLERKVESRTERLAALNTIAAVVSQSLDLDEILHDALDETMLVMGIDAGGIYLLDEAAEELTLAAHRGLSSRFSGETDRLPVDDRICGPVCRGGIPLVINDVAADPRLTGLVAHNEGPQSLAATPVSSKGKPLGTLLAVTQGKAAFTDQDIQLLTSIGHQVGVAVDNARLFEREQERAEQFRVISEVGRRITSILDVDELLDQMAHLIEEAFDYPHVRFGLVEGDRIVPKAEAGAWEAHGPPPSLEVGQDSVWSSVAQDGEPLLVPDVTQGWPSHCARDAAEVRSQLCVALKGKRSAIGVLSVDSDHLDAFDENDLTVLQSLADQAAVAIDNARLYEQAQQLAVVEERNRLARDLHDAVTQTLFSASLIAEALPSLWEIDRSEGEELLRELQKLSRGALAEMRTLLLELRPAALIEASLGDLLHQLAAAVMGRTDISVIVTVEGECELPEEAHVAFYRIAQEGLNNVVKHARAGRVWMDLCCVSSEEGDVCLSLRDDGCGFDLGDVPPERLGLEILRERADDIGAELIVESEIGCGTEIVVIWSRNQQRTSLPTS
jgi:nitrate/nitrite-specific signal transduction histidine kinase